MGSIHIRLLVHMSDHCKADTFIGILEEIYFYNVAYI
jgi:hypothetical protein